MSSCDCARSTQHSDVPAVLAEMQTRWSGAFNSEKWADLAALYLDDAQLFGGRPDLYVGASGVLAYFQTLKPGAHATFQPGASAVRAAAGCIIVAGIVDFRREGRERLHRMSWTLVATSDGWRIASHHASPVG